MKKGWKIVLCILLALVLVVGGYVAYVLIDYHRIGDQELAVQNGAVETSIAAGETYKIVSYNIGFGAYESDYGFFMDGGTESRAWSEERLTANLDRIARTLTDQNADFYLVQEVDIDSQLSRRRARAALCRALMGKQRVLPELRLTVSHVPADKAARRFTLGSADVRAREDYVGAARRAARGERFHETA